MTGKKSAVTRSGDSNEELVKHAYKCIGNLWRKGFPDSTPQ